MGARKKTHVALKNTFFLEKENKKVLKKVMGTF